MTFKKDVEEKIVDLFCNTQMSFTGILMEVFPNGDVSLEEIYEFIYNYRTSEGKPLLRDKEAGMKNLKATIYSLRRNENLSYNEISKYISARYVKNISVASISNICKEKAVEVKEERPSTLRRKSYIQQIPLEELYEKRKNGETYKQLKEYYGKKGIIVSYKSISDLCKQVFAEKGEKEISSR